MAISRQAVIHGFRYFLGREPESEQTIAAYLGMRDETEFAEVLLQSAEFSYGDRFRHLLALRAVVAQAFAWEIAQFGYGF